MQNKWLWGCGIGCGTLILLVGLMAVGISQLGLGEKAKTAMTNELEKFYNELKEKGTLKPELQEPIAEIITLLRRPETPFLAGATITGLVTECMTNEAIGVEKALPMVSDLRDLLKQKPEPSLDDVDKLCDKHGDVMRAVEEQARKQREDRRGKKQEETPNGAQQSSPGN